MYPQLLMRVCKDATLVQFTARHLDEHSISSFKEQLTDLAGSIGQKELRLDFEGVESMGSTALAMMVGLHRRVANGKGHVVLLNLAEHLVELFHLTRLDTILDIRSERPICRAAERASA